MRPLPFNVPGPDNDLNDVINHYIQRVMADPQSEDGFQVKRLSYFMGRLMQHCGWERDYNIRLELLEARRPADFTASKMDALVASGATSLFVSEDPLTSNIRASVIDQANRLRLPTISGQSEYALAGGLMSYGSSQKERYRRTADYVDKILKGTSPGDLPVEQPTKFQLVINLKTANSLGLSVPPSVLAIADEVVE